MKLVKFSIFSGTRETRLQIMISKIPSTFNAVQDKIIKTKIG